MVKLMKADLERFEAYYAGFIRSCKTNLPLNARVVMTPEAAAMFPRYKGVTGTVVGYKEHGTGASPKVLWDGRKTADSYAPWFIRRAALKSGAPGE